MKPMTDSQFKKKIRDVEERNRAYKQRMYLRSKYEYRPKIKLPSTSKLALWAVIVICIQIIWFAEKMVIVTGDMSGILALVGAVPSVVIALLGYYNKSAKENTVGGIVYESSLLEQKDKITYSETSDGAVG